MKASEASTNAWASTSGRSSTMAISISPQSFDKGWFSSLHLLQDCDCFVLTQVSFHFSIARCASDPVCGGTIRTAGAMWQLAGCNGYDCPADVIVLHLIGGEGFLCDS